MRSRVIVAVALAGLALTESSALAQRGRGAQGAARQGWVSSLSAGKQQAQKSGKPLMVVLRCVP